MSPTLWHECAANTGGSTGLVPGARRIDACRRLSNSRLCAHFRTASGARAMGAHTVAGHVGASGFTAPDRTASAALRSRRVRGGRTASTCSHVEAARERWAIRRKDQVRVRTTGGRTNPGSTGSRGMAPTTMWRTALYAESCLWSLAGRRNARPASSPSPTSSC